MESNYNDMQATLVKFKDSSSEEKAREAHKKLYFYINMAKLNLEELKAIADRKGDLPVLNKRETDRFEKWFGKFDETRLKRVLGLICDIHNGYEDKKIVYEYKEDEDEDTFAYVRTDEQTKPCRSYKIYLCQAFFNTDEEHERYDTALGTILHELTHLIGNTDDYEYGEDDCIELAKSAPEKAVDNADSYEMYLESFRNMYPKKA